VPPQAQFLPVGLMTAMAFGALYPQPGAAAAANGLQKLSTTGIFVVSGLLLKAGDAKRAVKEWPAVAYGVAAILALTPLIGGLGALSVPGLSRELAIGLAVFAAMPTSLSSCVTLTHAVGANSALALLLVVTTNTLGIFSMPFVLCRLLCTSTGVAIEPRPLLLALVQNILVPLAAGALVRAVARPVAAWVDANKRLMQYVSTGLLCLVPWMQISSTMLAKVSCRGGPLPLASPAPGSCLGDRTEFEPPEPPLPPPRPRSPTSRWGAWPPPSRWGPRRTWCSWQSTWPPAGPSPWAGRAPTPS